MRTVRIVRAVGEVKGADGPVSWIVQRGFPLKPARGFAWAGRALHFAFPTTQSKAVITRDLWGPTEAPSVCAVVLVSAILLKVRDTGGPGYPASRELHPRRPWEWAVNEKTVLEVTSMQRWGGDMFAVPLKLVDPEKALRGVLSLAVPSHLRHTEVERLQATADEHKAAP